MTRSLDDNATEKETRYLSSPLDSDSSSHALLPPSRSLESLTSWARKPSTCRTVLTILISVSLASIIGCVFAFHNNPGSGSKLLNTLLAQDRYKLLGCPVSVSSANFAKPINTPPTTRFRGE